MDAPTHGMKKVICPVKTSKGNTYWLRIGKAFPNRDGSTNVYLDAYPQNGKLQIRDLDERDLRPRGGGDLAAPADFEPSSPGPGPGRGPGNDDLPF